MRFHNNNLPVEGYKYRKIVGALLPNKVERVLSSMRTRELSYDVKVNPLQANDVDLWIYRNRRLEKVAEVMNWSIKSILSNYKKNCIVSNLCQYECERILICSVPSTITDAYAHEFALRSISTVCIGFQLLPTEFYEFFLRRNQVIRRKPDGPEAYEKIRNVIENYFFKGGY